MIYTTLHSKLNIYQHEPHLKLLCDLSGQFLLQWPEWAVLTPVTWVGSSYSSDLSGQFLLN
jgi:hypothetical protein